MTGFSFIGIAVTVGDDRRSTARRSGTRSTLVAQLLADLPVLLVVAMVIVVIAQISTNMAANVVSPSNDFSNLSPRQISFRTGGLITAVHRDRLVPVEALRGRRRLHLHLARRLRQPARLLPRGDGRSTTGCCGAARLNVAELYRYGEGGEYWFSKGYNWRALIAVAAGVIPVLPGFLNAATTKGGVVADPGLPRPALPLRRVRGVRDLRGRPTSGCRSPHAQHGARDGAGGLTVDFGVTFQTDPPAGGWSS